MAYIDITPEARVDISLAIDLCPVEISGIGEVAYDRDSTYHITETILFPQECYFSYTTFDQMAFERYADELNRKRVATRGPSGMNTKRLWWHSHVWGRARFSSIDRRYMATVGGDALLPYSPYLISIVGNKYGMLTTRLDVFKPVHRTEYTRLPLSDPSYTPAMLRDLYQERRPRMQKLIDDMVTIQPNDFWSELFERLERDEFSLREKP